MYDVIQLVICGIFTCKLELPEEGNDVLKAKRFSTCTDQAQKAKRVLSAVSLIFVISIYLFYLSMFP